MLVVDNSTLSALRNVQHLALLPFLFSKILIPLAVQNEFTVKWNTLLDNRKFVLQQEQPQWPQILKTNSIFNLLGRGEQEAIIWSLHYAGILVSDDKKVRNLCKKLKIRIVGTLGLCKLAYKRNYFTDKAMYYKVINTLVEDLYVTPKLIEWAKDV